MSAPAPGASAAPAGASLPPELREALERLNRQEAELKALRQEMAAERAARAEKDAADAAERQKLRAALDAQEKKSAERATGLLAGVAAVRSARLQLTLSGFVQADYSLRQSSEDQVDPATREPLNEDRFGIRRARLTVGADYGIVGGNVTIDGNTLRGTAIRVLGAEATLRWPAPKAGAPPGTPPLIAATFGSFKNPFGYEVSLQSDTQRLFVERSAVARALFPGEYDLGFRLQGGWRFLRYAFAIMNGEPIGERSFPVRDPNKAKDYLGRLGIDTELLPWLRIAAGVSALRGTGFDRGSPATKDTLVWRDLNENGSVDPGEVQVIAGTSAVPASNFSRFGFGGDFQLGIRVPRLGRLVLYGELAYAANLDRGIQPANPVTAARTLRELGWYLAATQELGRWAQIGIRYDRYNPDLDANDRQAGVLVPNDASVSTLSLVGAARFRDVARFIVEYDVNRNHLGRDASGRPTNLRDNALTLRAEVVF
ncbi:MAG TPA: hypothetical protein VH877_11305 [Polyangia bacterium]|nr:hypothetical protein [Polyangia bacterium]